MLLHVCCNRKPAYWSEILALYHQLINKYKLCYNWPVLHLSPVSPTPCLRRERRPWSYLYHDFLTKLQNGKLKAEPKLLCLSRNIFRKIYRIFLGKIPRGGGQLLPWPPPPCTLRPWSSNVGVRHFWTCSKRYDGLRFPPNYWIVTASWGGGQSIKERRRIILLGLSIHLVFMFRWIYVGPYLMHQTRPMWGSVIWINYLNVEILLLTSCGEDCFGSRVKNTMISNV